jgi:hypothetical protein
VTRRDGPAARRESLRRRRRFLWLPLGLLGVENLVVFARHYFGSYGFPWDFSGGYYATVAFWTSAVSHRLFPDWMPFQSMGYPFAINLQNGLWYPPFWLFPALGIPYSLRAAIVLQCLHVLLGAVGAFFFLRHLLRSSRLAAIGAFAYQLFGGFYSNAQHPDIVRAFAFLPWLFLAFAAPRAGEPTLPRRLLLGSLFLFLSATGGYPGNLISTLFLLGLLVALQALARRLDSRAIGWAAGCGAAAALGLAMAWVHLGPAWIFRGEIVRFYGRDPTDTAWLGITHLPTLFLNNRWLDQITDPSMSSAYVGIVILAAATLLTTRAIRRHWPWVVALLVAAAMLPGFHSPVYRAIGKLVPLLAVSRFPSSDYRGAVALLLILLALAALRGQRRRGLTHAKLAVRWTLLALFVAWAISKAYRGAPSLRGAAAAIACFLVALVAIWAWKAPLRRRGLLATAALLGAIALDAGRVLPRMRTWNVPDFLKEYRGHYPFSLQARSDGTVVDPIAWNGVGGARPARRPHGMDTYRSSGYLLGDFDLADWGNLVLRARQVVEQDPALASYMREPWRPILLDPAAAPPSLNAANAAGLVRQTSYALDYIDYEIVLPAPARLVENEIYFPGWTAELSTAPGAPLAAGPVAGALRSWQLPAGRYTMQARFAFPGRKRNLAVSLVGWTLWIAAVFAAFRSTRSGREKPRVARDPERDAERDDGDQGEPGEDATGGQATLSPSRP